MRGPRLLLAVSLVINIFLLGAIAGGLWNWSHARGPGTGGGWRLRAADALPAARAAELRQALRETMRDAQPTVLEARAARQAAAALFAAPRFDAPAALAQLDRARAADLALRARLEQRVVALAATMPAEQRVALAEALRRTTMRAGLRRIMQDGGRRERPARFVQPPMDQER